MGTRYKGSSFYVLALAGGLAATVGTPRAGAQQGQPPGAAPAQGSRQGRLECRIKENGAAASGTVVVRNGDGQVGKGSCGDPMPLAEGSYVAVLRLDGALDDPEKQQRVAIRGGKTARVEADFPTGVLKVDIEADGRRAPGTARIFRGGEQVGTLGSGVSAHLSAGSYTVVVRYRSKEKRFDEVKLAAGQRRNLRAEF